MLFRSVVTVSESEITPATVNDEAFSERLDKVAVATLGASHVVVSQPVMGSEDVGLFSLNNTIPAMMFRLGASDPDKLDAAVKAGKSLPGPHSPLFAPVYEPTIRTGVTTMTAMALDILK